MNLEKIVMSETRSMTTRAAAPADSAAPGGGPRRLGLALLVIATAQLMVVLDSTYPRANTAGGAFPAVIHPPLP